MNSSSKHGGGGGSLKRLKEHTAALPLYQPPRFGTVSILSTSYHIEIDGQRKLSPPSRKNHRAPMLFGRSRASRLSPPRPLPPLTRPDAEADPAVTPPEEIAEIPSQLLLPKLAAGKRGSKPPIDCLDPVFFGRRRTARPTRAGGERRPGRVLSSPGDDARSTRPRAVLFFTAADEVEGGGGGRRRTALALRRRGGEEGETAGRRSGGGAGGCPRC